MSSNTKWLVRLGSLEWTRYTYARGPDDPLHLIGSIKRGLQVGALGVMGDQQYVQVVGDFVTPLNSAQVGRAVAQARSRDPYAAPPVKRPAAAPVVIVKRRRILAGA